MTPGRSLRVRKGYSKTEALCNPMGGLPQLGVAWFVRRGRAVTIRSSFALPQPSTREIPDRRKGEGPATTPLRDYGTQSTTLRKRGKVAKLVLCHQCRGA